MKEKNHSIQALRGIAALIVFFSHTICMLNYDIIETLKNSALHLLFDGQCAVVIFFVLSGFFYYNTPAFTIRSYAHGVFRKFLRIYPTHIIVLIICLICCNAQIPYDLAFISEWGLQFWKHSVSYNEFLHLATILMPANTDMLNPPSWYLFWEVWMFIIVPLVVSVRKRFLSIDFPVTTIIPILAMALGKLTIPATFCIGILTAHVSRHMKMLPTKTTILIITTSLLLINIKNETSYTNGIINITQALGAAFLILLCATKSITFSKRNPICKIGDISYEFFLVHFPIILSLRNLASYPFLYIIVCLALSLIAAWILQIITNPISKLNTKFKNETYSNSDNLP